MKKSIALDIISCLFVLLFLYTGIFKLMDPGSVRSSLFAAPLPLLHTWARFLAIAVPVLEVLIGLTLLLATLKERPRYRQAGLYGATILMALFVWFVGFMLKYQPHLPCSCGGVIQQMNWHQHLYFNIGFTALGILGIWLNSRVLKTSSHEENDLSYYSGHYKIQKDA